MRNPISAFKTKAGNKAVVNTLVARGKKVMRELDTNSRNAEKISDDLLLRILEENKDTEYGKKYDFENIHSYEEYREKVPFSAYDDYEPYIKRMIENDEKNLISVYEPKHYALSSGSVGVPKHIPVSQAELDKYSKYGAAMAFGVADEFYRTTMGKGLPPGRGLNALELRPMQTKNGIPKGPISSTILSSHKDAIPYLVTSPWSVICTDNGDIIDMKYLKTRIALEQKDVAFMESAFMPGMVDLIDYMKEHYEMICSDIYHGRINKEIKMPAGLRKELEARMIPDRTRAARLMREFKKGFDTPIIPRIWPKLAWIGGIGTGGFFTYANKMRKYTGKNIPFNNLTYAASESLVATARHMGDTSYVLIPDGGFYEFIPAKNEYEPGKEETLTIKDLEIGEDYEIVLTNLSGFYRYRINDVVRVMGFYNECPMITFIYRKNQLLSIAGEKTNEEAVRWSVEQFMKDTGLTVTDYSVYADTDDEPGHYVILMEPDHIVKKKDIEYYREAIEKRLMQANPSYGMKINTGVLGKTELIFVQQETYMLYRDLMIMKGVSPDQLKPVRVIDTPIKEKFFFGLVEDSYEDDE